MGIFPVQSVSPAWKNHDVHLFLKAIRFNDGSDPAPFALVQPLHKTGHHYSPTYLLMRRVNIGGKSGEPMFG